MKKLILVLCLISSFAFGQKVTLFAASSTKLAMEEILQEFKNKNSGVEIDVYFSATGKAYAQFQNGFKYDIFMAADSKYPQTIVDNGDAISSPIVYAKGVVALYSKDKELLKDGIEALKNQKVKKISIANPKLAPYGAAAVEILKNYGFFDELSSKIVQGDNIAQSVQFVDSGAAELGLVAFSLIKQTHSGDEYMIIDSSKHSPMNQSFVLTKYAKDNSNAQKLADFITFSDAKEIFAKYGFGVEWWKNYILYYY